MKIVSNPRPLSVLSAKPALQNANFSKEQHFLHFFAGHSMADCTEKRGNHQEQ
jgi:hypothetical protein